VLSWLICLQYPKSASSTAATCTLQPADPQLGVHT